MTYVRPTDEERRVYHLAACRRYRARCRDKRDKALTPQQADVMAWVRRMKNAVRNAVRNA